MHVVQEMFLVNYEQCRRWNAVSVYNARIPEASALSLPVIVTVANSLNPDVSFGPSVPHRSVPFMLL
jgi:hypothetical protein